MQVAPAIATSDKMRRSFGGQKTPASGRQGVGSTCDAAESQRFEAGNHYPVMKRHRAEARDATGTSDPCKSSIKSWKKRQFRRKLTLTQRYAAGARM